MAQQPPYAAGGAIAPGARLTNYSSIDMTVEDSASGGMGLVVWGPNALNGGQMEAFKLLQPALLAAASSIEARATIERQFETEALVWCHLWPHQSVITANGLTRLLGLDMRALQLEYAPNGSLRDQLRLARQQRQPLRLESALAWALHIAAALAHIHQRDPDHERPEPLVHCDLKPENVLLNARGWAKLTDLGLTRAYAALAAETLPSITPGAASAPETPDRRALVAQLRAQLQGQGLLPSRSDSSQQAPDATTLYVTRTLAIPPTQITRRSSATSAAAPSDSAYGAAASAADEANAEEVIGAGVAGSPPYMAPEQWRGLTQTVPATDLYAYGVLLYELFAGFDAPAPFPRDPRSYLSPVLYAQAMAMGYDPQLLAWHAAHTDLAYRRGGRGLGQSRLSDLEVWAAALRSGPCAELLADGAAGRQRAEACLAGVDALVERCLAYAPNRRPAASEVMETLQLLAVETSGLQPPQVPQPLPVTPQREGMFWSNLGLTYGNLNRRDEALAAQRRAHTHTPDDPVKWINLGNALLLAGVEARNEGERTRARGDVQDAEPQLALAKQHFEEALDSFQQAQTHVTAEKIAEYPGLLAGLAANQAAALAYLDRYREAVATCEQALAQRPDKHDTRFNLALYLARWSLVAEATVAERVARLEAAQREITTLLAAAPQYSGARSLTEDIARALADPAHRFQG